MAVTLFELAARRYRRELWVEPLARLRVHQLIAESRARRDRDREGDRALEIERRLCRLDRIESLAPPFPLVEARTLLASWMSDAGLPEAGAREAA